MARLELNQRTATAEGCEPATVVEFNGSIDPGTLEIFEEVMDRLIDENKVRVIFDLHRLKYINSTGMGMLVQFVDALTEENGGFALMRIKPKVLLVIEMLGLQELFQIVSDEAEAMVALSGGAVFPTSIEVKLDEVAPIVMPPDVEEIPSIEEVDQPTQVAVSQEVECPTCTAVLALPAEGTYRCPRCRSFLRVGADGDIMAYPEPVNEVSEMSIPADTVYFHGATNMVKLAGTQAGFDDTTATAMAESAEGCLAALSQALGNGTAGDKRLHLFIRPGNNRLVVRIYCGGDAIASPEIMDAYRGGVDRLDYLPSAEGNLLTLEKSI